MNVNKIQLPPITCNHNQAKPVLEIIVHNILFCRTLGVRVSCKEVESYFFDDVMYVVIDDDNIINIVKQELTNVCQSNNEDMLPITISLFYSIKKNGILGEYDEKIEFERWKIDLNLMSYRSFVEEDVLRNEIKAAVDTILNYQELPEQMPNYEKFSFHITSVVPHKDGGIYDMIRSLPRMFATP